MRLVKPAHVVHNDDKERPGTIFSLSVHPDGSRLATGGIDTKIKIWSTVAILNDKAEQSERVPKLLSTLTTHSGQPCLRSLRARTHAQDAPGVIMCVRWSHAGRYLASGSDDNIVIVWSLDSLVLALRPPYRATAFVVLQRCRGESLGDSRDERRKLESSATTRRP